MAGKLTLLRGPAGSGKSGKARAMLEGGEDDVLADYTAIWAAITAAERDPSTGKYPERVTGDALLPLVSYVKSTIARAGLQRGFRVVVTTSDSAEAEVDKWRDMATGEGARFSTVTADPGEDVVRARLMTDPNTGEALSAECQKALRRWYG